MSATGHRRPRVLVCDRIAADGIELLETQLDVDVVTGLDEDGLVERIADYEAVVVRSATRITRRVIEHAERLRVIARAGAGLDAIDVEAAVERDVQVVNSPDANTLAVAELTMALVLALARNLTRADAAMKDGRWEKSALLGSGLSGKTLGIVGFGRIGQAVALRAQAFGMRVVTNQRRPTPELYLEKGVEPLDLYDLLAVSDYVSLHVPARPDTEGLIGAPELAAMKATAHLVNTSRGVVVEEAALLDALDRGTIAGAALDVFVEEPAVDSALARHPKVIATPHLGASTTDAQSTAAIEVARRILELLAGTDAAAVLPLRVVPLDQVVAHEATDPERVRRLADRILEEGIIRNPPIVSLVEDRYVVLDGATRSAALDRLGCDHVVVQDVADERGLGLETWHHVLRGLAGDELAALVGGVDGVRIETTDAGQAVDRVIEYGGICALLTVEGDDYAVFAESGRNRFDVLADLAAAYIERAEVSRTLERDPERLRRWYPDMTALVEYPQFTVEQVLAAARSGRLLPAGVTRFVVPGRVLRIDIPLSVLEDDRTLDEKNRWLHDLLAEKERTGRIRYYREPVYLLDE